MKKISPIFKWPRPFPGGGVVVVLALLWVALLCGEARSQITPEGRDRTYKQAAPGRFEKRFEKPSAPRSTVVPVKPETLKPVFPPGLKEVKFTLRKLVIRGSTIFTKITFASMFRKILRKEVTLEHIYRVANAITTRYRNQGYILSKAVIPPQKIENGRVRIEIIEGYIDKVLVQGKVRGPKRLLNAYRKNILASKPLHAKDLERYLLLMDDLPGVTVKSVLTPSEKPGATNLTIILENKSFDANAGIDNRGSKFNGPIQLFGGANANSLMGGYERTGVSGVVTSDPDELMYFGGFYEMPVSAEGTKLFFSGSVSESAPGSSLEEFKVEGESSSVQLLFSHPFIRTRGENLNAHFGFTSRDSKTDILGTTDSEDRLRVLDLGASYDFADRHQGVNVVSLNLLRGLNVFNTTETGSDNLSREQGVSDFTKITGEVLRLQQLAPSWMLLGSVSWQYSFDKLLSSEEFGFGGPRFGRGFDSSEITGDSGISLKLELQKAFRVNKKYFQGLQIYGFYDYGSVWNRVQTSTVEKRQGRYSIGLGGRFNLTKEFSGYVEIAKPLADRVSSEGNRDPRVFFGFTARY